MPRLVLILAAACTALLVGCANNASMTADSSSRAQNPSKDAWVYMIHPSNMKMLEKPTPTEQELLAGHFAYLQDLTRKGVVILAGPCTDDSGLGIVVFEAPNENAARQIMQSDPAVSGGVFIAELHPMRLSLLRERDM
jgi:uncharacterized protein YciI